MNEFKEWKFRIKLGKKNVTIALQYTLLWKSTNQIFHGITLSTYELLII